MRQVIIGLLMVALGAVVAPGAALAGTPTLGGSVTGVVYVHESRNLTILNRSKVPVEAAVDTTSTGWTVQPESVVLKPGQRTDLTVNGNGKDGATLTVQMAATATPPPGEGRGVMSFGVKVYRDRPFDLYPVLFGALLVALTAGVLGGMVWRRRAAQIRAAR